MTTETTPKKATVFVSNYAGHDYTKAEVYGNLEFITRNHLRLDDVKTIVQTAQTKLANSTENDFLLLSGSSLISIIAYQILADRHGRVNLLYHDKKGNVYRTYTIHTK